MDTFIAQLNQLLMSADEDFWLAGLCNILQAHTGAWVRLARRGGKVIAEAIPHDGIPENPAHYIERLIIAGDAPLGRLSLSSHNPFTPADEQMLDVSICICIVHLRQKETRSAMIRKQKIDAVREAINALSFSELEAAAYILQELGGLEGRLVAGHIADKLGFTRSIVVTALKKLEGAGVIETRSLGVKGTYIRVRESLLLEELGKLGTANGV